MPFCDRVVCVSRDQYLPSHNRKVAVPKNPTTIGGHLRRRRLQLKIFQSEAARRLHVSTVTLSRWECDKVYPTWKHYRSLIEYLGYDPFPSCGLKDPYGNEPPFVAILCPETLGQHLRRRRLELKLTLTECASRLAVDRKTARAWEQGRHLPCREHQKVLIRFLGA